MIVAAASGGIPAFVDTGLNLVHVDDVALGHLAALERGRVGERYILGGQNVPFRQMLHDIAGIMGRNGPKFRLPWYSALPVA
jgi:dihydroflavonol-4-reductase